MSNPNVSEEVKAAHDQHVEVHPGDIDDNVYADITWLLEHRAFHGGKRYRNDLLLAVFIDLYSDTEKTKRVYDFLDIENAMGDRSEDTLNEYHSCMYRVFKEKLESLEM